MKKLTATLIPMLIASAVFAGGYVGTVAQSSKTGNFAYTNTSTSPMQIERIDIRCSSANTATVALVQYGITSTLHVDTNTATAFAPATANYRIDKGGVLTVTFGNGNTTNSVAVYTFTR